MVRRIGCVCVLMLAGGAAALAQIGFPGQYPTGIPGGYPPGQYPPGQYPGQYPQGGRRGRTNTSQNSAPHQFIDGMIRRISSSQVTMEADDSRIIAAYIVSSTKFSKITDGQGTVNARLADFQPGDHITLDVTQDDNSAFTVSEMKRVRVGTDADVAAAKQPLDSDTVPLGSGGGSRSASNSDADNDPGRPRLKRAPGSSDTGTVASSSTPDDNDPDRPRLRRTPSPADQPSAAPAPASQPVQTADNLDSDTTSRPATTVAPRPVPPDPDDPGPPRLTHNRAANVQRASADTPEPVSSGPPRVGQPAGNQPDDLAPRRLDIPPDRGLPVQQDLPPRNDATSIIDRARQAAFEFSQTLPNYEVKQFTTRYQTESARGRQTSWRAVDTITADVKSQAGRDTYSNLMINGRASSQSPEHSGAWSTGEFSSLLLDVLSPYTDAEFRNKRSTTIANHAAVRYEFSVDQPNSHWHVNTESQSYNPAYSGAIWIDQETFRVLRIELAAQDMPRGFPLDTVESAVDYDYVRLGDSQQYLLPTHAEALSCARGTADCQRNVTEFRNYKKFSADTSITFEGTNQ